MDSAAEKLQKIMADPVLFAKYFCKITNKQNKTVPFIMNHEQEDFIRNMDRFNIILKSRQIGFSVCNALLAIYYCITMPNIHCMLASYSLDSANTIYGKLRSIYYSIPDSIKPKEVQNNRKELAFENGSRITVTTLGNKDVSRGSSLYFVHISEWGFVDDIKAEKHLTAILETLVDGGRLVIESTANGINHLYEEWNKAVNGENLFKPFFYGWIDEEMHADEYKDYSKRYKAIHGKHLEMDELDEKEQGYFNQGATLEQLEWRRVRISNSGEDKFNQEMPADPLCAFISSSRAVFSASLIQSQYDAVKSLKTLNNNAVSMPQALKPYIANLTLWDIPKNGERYVISCDSAEGLGKDYSDIEVYSESGIQFAQWRSNKTEPYKIAEILNALGLWFNKATIGVEKASTGGQILDKLKNEYKYRALYKHKDYDAKGNAKKKLGYCTNSKTKPIMISDLQEWFNERLILIKSPVTLSEMKTYMFDGSSTNAVRGLHDDSVMSTSIIIQMIKSGIRYLWT